MSERVAVLLSVIVLCAPSCIGTETDNPVAGFEPTACKSEGGSALRLPGVMRTSEALTLDSRDYDGLYCFAWEARASGRMHISVFNMIAGCHIDWELGPSRIDANGLRLRVRNDECAVAGCGSCAYDLSFDVEGVDATAPLPLSLTQLDCDDEPTRRCHDADLADRRAQRRRAVPRRQLGELGSSAVGSHFRPAPLLTGRLTAAPTRARVAATAWSATRVRTCPTTCARTHASPTPTARYRSKPASPAGAACARRFERNATLQTWSTGSQL